MGAIQGFCFQYKVMVINIEPNGHNIKIGDRVIVDFDKEKFPHKWAQVIEVLQNVRTTTHKDRRCSIVDIPASKFELKSCDYEKLMIFSVSLISNLLSDSLSKRHFLTIKTWI